MTLITESGPETLPIGADAPRFEALPGTDGKSYGMDSFEMAILLVVSFTCNHCPYAQAYERRFVALANEYGPRNVAFIAINPNDVASYPDDSMRKMKERVAEKDFPFPYVRDDDQSVARAFGAVCTPHFFVLNAERKIVYEGRLDDNWRSPAEVTREDLRSAIDDLLAGNEVDVPNTNPLGCSIKWLNS